MIEIFREAAWLNKFFSYNNYGNKMHTFSASDSFCCVLCLEDYIYL